MNDRKTNVALVTGASSGIGLEYARQLAARGYAVVAVSNEEEKVREACSLLNAETGIPLFPVCLDLARPEAARELYELCERNEWEAEILVNNAGIFFFNDLTGVEDRRIATMLRLHVETVTLLCRYFGEAMRKRGHGYILNMSSMSAWMPFPGISVYAATKSYLKTLSLALHNELYDAGVGVTAVCPGAVATDLYSLSRKLQRLAVRLGIMMTPERLVRKGLRAMFRRRKSVVPGLLNRFLIVLLFLVPGRLTRLVKRKAKFYRYGK